LTPSQSAAVDIIVDALNNGLTYLNLWGAPGVGKTFLAHHLAQQYGGIYLSSPDQPTIKAVVGKWLCVDNVPAIRTDARAIYSRLLWQRATAVLVISQDRVLDSLFPIQLQLTANDRFAVRATLHSMYPNCTLPDPAVTSASLWMFVRSCTHIDSTTNSLSG
jgi:hypothetical protein